MKTININVDGVRVTLQLTEAEADDIRRQLGSGTPKKTKAVKTPRVVPVAQQLKMVRGALASPKTPERLLPSLRTRLAKLEAAAATA